MCSYPDEVNSYEIKEIFRVEECSLYSMIFMPNSQILFRISTSGKCNNLTSGHVLNAIDFQLGQALNNASLSKDILNPYVIIEVPLTVMPTKDEINKCLESFNLTPINISEENYTNLLKYKVTFKGPPR